MSSIIKGYNYDIFISYRQKDNQPTPGYGWQSKGDRWVSEFVEALKAELESTFKEEISLYFDVNAHDGLLEMHDVEASLREKLKCLIFIPVLSRTYCDPRSFAWEHEFKAFVEQASRDQFGLKVRLPDGNVAGRVLPVLIHDLDPADIKEIESVLGGVLRGVQFIYKEPGVNRSLTPGDQEEKNLNNTNYRNQINKVALAVKEILSGLKREPGPGISEKAQPENIPEEVREEQVKGAQEKPDRSVISKLLPVILITTLLIIAALIAYPKIFKPDKLQELRSKDEVTIAVMPFQNMTGDTTWNIWQEGIQNELISSLTNTQELKVRQTETINNFLRGKDPVDYASLTPSKARDISQKLDANIFIYGTIKQAGENIRLNASLVDSKTDEIFRSFEIDGDAREEMIFQLIDSLKRKVSNFLVINKLLSGISHQEYFYDFGYSNSPEAYRYFIYGANAFAERDYPRARSWFHQALKVDSGFVFPALYIASSYGNQGLYEEAKEWSLKIYSKKDLMPVELKLLAEWLYANYFETPGDEIRHLKQALEIDEKLTIERYLLGLCYMDLNQYDKAITEFEKLFEVLDEAGLKHPWVYNYYYLGIAYHETGEYGKEKKLYKKAEKDFPGDNLLLRRQAILALSTGKTKSADEYIRKYIFALEDRSSSEAVIASGLGGIYRDAGMLQKAEEKYREALSLQPESATRMNNLGYILINNEINIEEGLELVEKAVSADPDNYLFLDTKGWGLYKQGNYEEALELIERSWELKPIYDHDVYLHLEAARKAVKNNHSGSANQ